MFRQKNYPENDKASFLKTIYRKYFFCNILKYIFVKKE